MYHCFYVVVESVESHRYLLYGTGGAWTLPVVRHRRGGSGAAFLYRFAHILGLTPAGCTFHGCRVDAATQTLEWACSLWVANHDTHVPGARWTACPSVREPSHTPAPHLWALSRHRAANHGDCDRPACGCPAWIARTQLTLASLLPQAHGAAWRPYPIVALPHRALIRWSDSETDYFVHAAPPPNREASLGRLLHALCPASFVSTCGTSEDAALWVVPRAPGHPVSPGIPSETADSIRGRFREIQDATRLSAGALLAAGAEDFRTARISSQVHALLNDDFISSQEDSGSSRQIVEDALDLLMELLDSEGRGDAWIHADLHSGNLFWTGEAAFFLDCGESAIGPACIGEFCLDRLLEKLGQDGWSRQRFDSRLFPVLEHASVLMELIARRGSTIAMADAGFLDGDVGPLLHHGAIAALARLRAIARCGTSTSVRALRRSCLDGIGRT